MRTKRSSGNAVRGTWARDAPPGTVLQKRGEMPEEAYISVAELRSIYEKAQLKHKSLPFISLSHYWRTKSHPDPEGETPRSCPRPSRSSGQRTIRGA